MRKISRYIAILVWFVALPAQSQFGIEWIDFNQSYFKIKISNTDFYRITAAELQAVGFPVSIVPANRIQLFRKGEEVAINVDDTGGVLNYLEFYGEAIDGTSDTPLYDPGDQPHTFYNLFSDTATYFLTYKLGNESGRRISFSADQDASGLSPEPFHIDEVRQVYTTNYAQGVKFGFGAVFSLSKYDNGEGWTGSFIGKAGFSNHDFVLENRVVGEDPICDYVLIGGNSQNHNAIINAGPNATSLSQIGSTQFIGWGSASNSLLVPESNISSSGELTIQVLREGFEGVTERLSVAYMRIKYAQDLAISSTENKIFILDNPSSDKAYLQISTSNASGTSLYNINDSKAPIRIATANFSDRVDAVVPNAVSGQRILGVTSPVPVASIQPVVLTNPDLVNKNYLIVSHPMLNTAGGPVVDYKNYRESVPGGNYIVEVINVDEIYDLFNYGDPSPLGIRNFIQYAASISTIDYILILGKGLTPNYNYYRGDLTEVNIPTFGFPGSDLMYTLGINSDSNAPGIPIGRLNAFKPADVTAYLNKVIEMEALPFDGLWRKDFLQLSGGKNETELKNFSDNINHFSSILENDFMGGRSFNLGKQTSESVENIDVTGHVNDGVGYVTFFGHSGGTSTDIEIGRVSDLDFGFSNKSRYPVFLVNGCKAGEIFGNNVTFGEDWMITPDLGSVGFIAHADLALSSTLKKWSDLFYELAFGDEDFIGESVGNVMVEVSRRYLIQNGSSNSSLTQVQQMLYEGDPAYRVFGADYPDYYIDDSSLFPEPIQGSEILASQDSFKINIIVRNFGRTVTDSLLIQIDRTLSDGTTLNYLKKFLRPLRLDTLEFFITNDLTSNIVGQNLFSVQLDPLDSTTELNEVNNSASIEFPIFSGNTTNLFPTNNGTLSSETVEFIWQPSNMLEGERTFDLEFDTTPTFDSPNRRFNSITGELIIKSEFDFVPLGLPDSTTIYWRTRLANPEPDETNIWVNSTFTLINDIPNGGWGQYTTDQIEDAVVTGVSFNGLTSQWEFILTTTPIEIATFGSDHPTLLYDDIETIVDGVDLIVTSITAQGLDIPCRQSTLGVIAFDKESGAPYKPIPSVINDVFNDEVCGRIPQRVYNFTEADILLNDRLQILVDNMRDGDQIVLFNIGNITYSNWDVSVETTLNSLGISSTTINNLTDGQPVIMLGKKGDPPGSAIEIVNDGTGTPITEQSIELLNNVSGSYTSGSIRSDRIGPVKDWIDFSFNISEDANDTYTINVYGIDENGVESVFPEFERGRAETLDISTIDPLLYPEVELEFSFSDPIDLTTPQLNLWEVSYSSPPEGIIISENKSISTFNEGEDINRSLSFHNYSDVDFSDSLDVEIRLINQNTGNSQSSSIKIAPPLSGDTSSFITSFSSVGYGGMNSMIVNVSANENEAYDFNNRLTLVNLIEVETDEINPVMDVTFDGIHILDGDIVSPTPNISIRVRDENQFLFKTDTSGISISIKLPGVDNQYQRINFSDPTLSFTAASESQDYEVNYMPGTLSDGVYGLKVIVEDERGNKPGEPYEVSFEVINESTITHFYPYPNPFSTNCRFVFTLTGSEIPDQIKIQIMTVSGRVVREITQNEIGPIRIGNNITEYSWDGRDEYGDQLANGVYFYKVFINSNGQSLERRSTSADGAFKNGFGKLYILR
jgi:hypothetical protein